MSFEPRDYLQHILIEANYLASRSVDLTFEAFVADETLRRAFVLKQYASPAFVPTLRLLTPL